MSRRNRHLALALFVAAYAGAVVVLFAPQGYFLYRDAAAVPAPAR